MDHAAIRKQMPVLVAGHVPRNARSFKFRILDGEPQHSILGFTVDPHPFDGTVVATTDEVIVIKTGRAEFTALDRQRVTTVPDVNAKVRVRPYARRRYDGQRADTPEERCEHADDGTPYTVRTHLLGAAPAKLPVPEPQCPELRDLIQQLEELPAPDRHRRITHVLVDAAARDFELVDPSPDKIIETPPAISFTVTTRKFAGRVTVLYDRGGDVYAVELRSDGKLLERVDEVYFDDLGNVLDRLIDDGSWRRIGIDIIDSKTSGSATADSA